MVEATGFEPTTLWSRTIRATNCATPQYCFIIYIFEVAVNCFSRRAKQIFAKAEKHGKGKPRRQNLHSAAF